MKREEGYGEGELDGAVWKSLLPSAPRPLWLSILSSFLQGDRVRMPWLPASGLLACIPCVTGRKPGCDTALHSAGYVGQQSRLS